MIEQTSARWLLGAVALIFVQCAGDKQSSQAESPMPPPAEPPAEMTASQPAASTAAQPQAQPAPGEAAKSTDTKAEEAKKADEPKAAPLSDAQIAAITDIANTAEIEQAKLARTKSKNAEVQKFSAMMIAHHGEAKQKQAKLKITTADSAASTKLLEEGGQVLASLKDTKGADFDRRYIEAQVDGHQKVLDTINNQLLPNVKSPELKAYLEEIKPKVEQHLQAARTAQQAIESSSGSKGTSGGTSMK
jgi:putative membrane protein